VLAKRLIEFVRGVGFPNGFPAVGFCERDLEAQVKGALPQARVINNAPRSVGPEELRKLYAGALAYW